LNYEFSLSRIGEHLTRQIGSALCGIDDGLQFGVICGGLAKAALQQACVACNGAQQVVKIMCNTAREQTDALEPLFFKQLLFEMLTLRDIRIRQYGADYSAVLSYGRGRNS
jgi:hypothetical protein